MHLHNLKRTGEPASADDVAGTKHPENVWSRQSRSWVTYRR